MPANESVLFEVVSPNNCALFNNALFKSKILSGDLKISDKRGRSKVWKLFGKIENLHNKEIANVVACRNCFNIYTFTNKSTSNLV